MLKTVKDTEDRIEKSKQNEMERDKFKRNKEKVTDMEDRQKRSNICIMDFLMKIAKIME